MERKEHLSSAKDYERLSELARDTKSKANTIFYAAIEHIEAILANYDIHSSSHEDRGKTILNLEISGPFTKDSYKNYEELIRKRNLAGYRGINGKNIESLKKLLQFFKGVKIGTK